MELSNLVVSDSVIEAEYPYAEGFKVNLSYVTKDELMSLRDKAKKLVVKSGRNAPVYQEIDEEKLQKLYIERVIKGWSGLSYEILGELLPIDLSKAEGTELAFSISNAEYLVRNCSEFDNWVTEVLNDVSAFTKGGKAE